MGERFADHVILAMSQSKPSAKRTKSKRLRWLFAVLSCILIVIGWIFFPGALQLFAYFDEVKPLVCVFKPGEGPEMVVIPAGSFLMGETDSGNESPEREVTIERPFAMSRCEVTFDDYQAFADAIGRKLPDDESWGRGGRPVINVSWEDAVAYALWLSDVTGNRYRLPSEAEWEYVARADSRTRFWWGDDAKLDGKVWANCANCGSQWDLTKTAPVGSFPANDFGLYDTAGNVWEWVQDCWHDNYVDAPSDGSAWESSKGGDCGRRVIRGGSWGINAGSVRSALRGDGPPGWRGDGLGFRLAQDLN